MKKMKAASKLLTVLLLTSLLLSFSVTAFAADENPDPRCIEPAPYSLENVIIK